MNAVRVSIYYKHIIIACAAITTLTMIGALLYDLSDNIIYLTLTGCFFTILVTQKKQIQSQSLVLCITILIAYYITAFYLVITIPNVFAIDITKIRISLALLKNLLICTLLFIACIIYLKKNIYPSTTITVTAALFGLAALIPVEHNSVKLQYVANSYASLILVITILDLNLKGNINYLPKAIPIKPLSLVLLFSIPLAFVISFMAIPTEFYVEHQQSKGFELYNNYPITWWSVLGDKIIPRFPGTSEDPILYGYICASLTIVAFANRNMVLTGILIVATLISLSKGAIIWMITTIILAGLTQRVRQRNLIYITFVAALIYLYITISGTANTSANVHIVGLLSPIMKAVSSFELSSIIGHGIGSSGNLLKISLLGEMTNDEWLGGGAESGIGLLVYQTGLLGAGLFIIVVCSLFKRYKSPYSKCAWLIYWTNALMQENLINLNYVILVGFVVYSCETLYELKKTKQENSVTKGIRSAPKS